MNANRTYYSREAEMRVARERITLTLVCVLLGLGIGGVLALLFAPAPGKQTRDELAHSLESGVNTGRERVEPAISQIQRELSDLRRKVEERLS
ncbi:MAG: YtxH domain-containing protein [Aggregatilineales bacterium]